MKYGADPLKQLIARENRRNLITRIKDNQLILTIFLGLDPLLINLEKIENARGLPEKLRIIANILESDSVD